MTTSELQVPDLRQVQTYTAGFKVLPGANLHPNLKTLQHRKTHYKISIEMNSIKININKTNKHTQNK